MKRTNIVIDEDLIEKVMEITHAKSKREAVQIALEQVVKKSSLASALERLRGKLDWAGNLHKMRRRRLLLLSIHRPGFLISRINPWELGSS